MASWYQVDIFPDVNAVPILHIAARVQWCAHSVRSYSPDSMLEAISILQALLTMSA